MIYKSPPYFLSNFKPMGLFYSEDEVQNRFSRWQLWGPWTFSYFLSTSHLDDSYQVSSQLAFRFRRRRGKFIFKKSWISDCINLSHFLFYQSPLCFLPRLEPIGPSIQKKWEIDFQDGHHGHYLGFPIGKILFIYFIFYFILFFFFLIYKSPLCFLPSFKSIGLLVQEKKRKTDFQDVAILYFR